MVALLSFPIYNIFQLVEILFFKIVSPFQIFHYIRKMVPPRAEPAFRVNTNVDTYKKSLLTKQELAEFNSVYHDELVKTMIELNSETMMEEPELLLMSENHHGHGHDDNNNSVAEKTTNWLLKVMNYNVIGGKKIRGQMVVFAYKNLVEKPTKENLRLAYIVGWLMEMMQGASLIADDIVDGSETRRGKTCWYKLNNVGLNAVNDVLLIEAVSQRILRIYLGNKPYYQEMVDLVHDVIHKTVNGQKLDCAASLSTDIVQSFTLERYNAIVKYKTSYFTVYLPVALAIIMAEKSGDKETFSRVREIMLDIGNYFQVQDDYLDCFGDSKTTGKIGTDIQDRKCTWLFVQCVKKCGPEQLKFLLENYGSEEKEKVERVRFLYEDLNLRQEFKQFEKASMDNILGKAEKLPPEFAKVVCQLLHNLHQRQS